MSANTVQLTSNMSFTSLKGFNYFKLLFLIGMVSLSACGGGGGGSSDDDSENIVETLADVSTENDRVERLNSATTWMYQIQELDEVGAVEALAATNYPMLVIEPGNNFDEDTGNYDTADIISKLRMAPNGDERLILAYIDIGEAEDYRDYWQDNWVAPTEANPGQGSPDFIVTIDPDGWEGNYPVAYWRSEWQSLWIGNDGIIKKLAALGFDGIYLDWVEAYDDDSVIAFAGTDGVDDTAEEMVVFIERLRAAGRSITRDFLVVAQNAPYLIEFDLDNNTDRYTDTIDALAVEDTWFYGLGDSDWDDTDGGDQTAATIPEDTRQQGDYSTENRITIYKEYLKKDLPVFTIDYALTDANALIAYTESRNEDFVPLVSRVSLSKVTETPPENY